MPAAILDYINKQDFNFVLATQKSINDNYIADMAKYATTNETVKIMTTYQSLPAQLAKENRKFQYKLIKTGARAYDYEVPISWLESSGIVNKIHKVNEGKLPLTAFADYSSFKIYLTDTGLLCSKFGVPANKVLSTSSDLDNFKGALAENYVASSLRTQGYTPFYWESNGLAEVDFIIQNREGDIIPIERLFKIHIGVSPKKLLNMIRYQYLLQDIVYNCSFDVHNAVFEYGFSDQAHLINEFKRFHTMTPLKAREFAFGNK